MIVSGQLPAILPKLCVVAKSWIPAGQPLAVGIVRLRRDGQVLTEVPIDATATDVSSWPADVRWFVLQTVITMAPFPVEAACVLQVEYEADGEVTVGPRLRVKVAESLTSTH